MKKKILIVDDDPTSNELVKSLLEEHNYIVVVAFDGEEGLKKAKEEKPDLVVLDVIMPKKGGYIFLREFKKISHPRMPPVVVLTAKDQLEHTFKTQGVADYFVKPLKTNDFIKKIDRIINSAYLCPTCKKPALNKGHLCAPFTQKDEKCQWCGVLVIDERHLCGDKAKALAYICNSCGRTAVKEEFLCNPGKIK